LNIKDYDFDSKTALVRVDFNVPVRDGKVADDTRIRRAIPTIKKILTDGGAVVLMSHLGRPKDGPEEKYSLKPVAAHLADLIDKPVTFVGTCIGKVAKSAVDTIPRSSVVLLENLRFHSEEKKGDEGFAKELADLGADVYVNDAFGTAHRAHASTSVIAQFFQDKMFGYLMEAEVTNAQRVLENAEAPFTAILGGAKVSDKMTIIENLLPRVNNLIIGGGMAYTFIKAQGGKIGTSICEDDKMEMALKIIDECKERGINLMLPTDTIIADKFAADAKVETSPTGAIKDNWMGLDIGPETITNFRKHILLSKTILWNGPMGVFEMKPFQNGTVAIARTVAETTELGAFSLIGGGDSVAAVQQFDLADRVSYVSTGGGALLEFFEGKTLPGIAAMEA